MSERDKSTLSQFSIKDKPIALSDLFPTADPDLVDLLQKMLRWNPDNVKKYFSFVICRGLLLVMLCNILILKSLQGIMNQRYV
jgi:hypothetical protein